MATLHADGIAAMMGPLHGCAWLFSIFAALRDPRGTPRLAVLAAIPAFGGLLAVRRLDHADAATASTSSV
jgi:hypothetical protein